MNPEAQRIAIAEACGWTDVKSSWEGQQCFGYENKDHGYVTRVPDYLNDLNAMHEAENTLLNETWESPLAKIRQRRHLWSKYKIELNKVCFKTQTPSIHATAAQRAEAFLKAKNLWTTGERKLK
jgi:hypothetical protein